MSVYNKRLDYPATECAGTSVEGERVRAAARPHPTNTDAEPLEEL